ncbi:MAG: GatB/YqeY domain-containing protein [Gammaproteobacteria bacterium]|nr:GatB/YqeY domain-containing protein [Gammaproteobacteria bacterium]
MSLKAQIQSDMKDAMRAKEKERLSVIRMLLAAIQTREIEERGELSDQDVLAVVEKLVKQRKDSAKQFADAGRPDREAAELSEAEQLQGYLPEQMSSADIAALVDEVVAATGASGMQDMGKIMGQLKAKAQGRADMGQLSALVKAKLSA